MKEALNFNPEEHVIKRVEGLTEIANTAFFHLDSNLMIKAKDSARLGELGDDFIVSLKLFFDEYDDKFKITNENAKCKDCTPEYIYNKQDLAAFRLNTRKIADLLDKAQEKYEFSSADYSAYSGKLGEIVAEAEFNLANLEREDDGDGRRVAA